MPVGGSDVPLVTSVVSNVLIEGVEASDDIVTSVGLVKGPVSVLTDVPNGVDGSPVVSVGSIGLEELADVYPVVVSGVDGGRSEVTVPVNSVVPSEVPEIVVWSIDVSVVSGDVDMVNSPVVSDVPSDVGPEKPVVVSGS